MPFILLLSNRYFKALIAGSEVVLVIGSEMRVLRNSLDLFTYNSLAYLSFIRIFLQ